MYRKLSLSKGSGTCSKCSKQIKRGRTCWAAKLHIGNSKFTYWSFQCFECTPSTLSPEEVA